MTPSGYAVHASTRRSAFGRNYRATRADGAEVILKVLAADAVSQLDLDHLRQTVDALQQFHHHAIAGHNALIDFRGDLVLTSAYVEGVDVASLVEISPMPARVAVLVAAEVAGALLAAHEANDSSGDPLRLRHGDLKPASMIMNAEGDVAITGFGLSRVADAYKDRTLTMFVESQSYMPPERLDGQESEAADVYALALSVAYMVTGDPPPRTSAHPQRHEQRRESLIAGMRESLATDHHALADLVDETLSYDPEGRPSMREFARRCVRMGETFGGPQPGTWAEPLVAVLEAADPDVVFDDHGGALSSSIPLAEISGPPTMSPMPMAGRLNSGAHKIRTPSEAPAAAGSSAGLWAVGAGVGVALTGGMLLVALGIVLLML